MAIKTYAISDGREIPESTKEMIALCRMFECVISYNDYKDGSIGIVIDCEHKLCERAAPLLEQWKYEPRLGRSARNDPAQFQAVFSDTRPESPVRVLLSAPDAGTADKIAAAIGRTPTEGQ